MPGPLYDPDWKDSRHHNGTQKFFIGGYYSLCKLVHDDVPREEEAKCKSANSKVGKHDYGDNQDLNDSVCRGDEALTHVRDALSLSQTSRWMVLPHESNASVQASCKSSEQTNSRARDKSQVTCTRVRMQESEATES